MASKQSTNDTSSEVAVDQIPVAPVKKRPRKRVEKSTDLPSASPADEQKAGLAQAILAAYNASNQQQSQPETDSAKEVAEPIVGETSAEAQQKSAKPKKSSTKSEAESSKVKSKSEKPKKKSDGEKAAVVKPAIPAPIEEQTSEATQIVEKADEQQPEKKKRSLPSSDNEPPTKKKKPSTTSGKSKKKLEEIATTENVEVVDKPSSETSTSDELAEKKVDLDQLTPAKRKRLENKEKRKRVKEEAKNFALPKGLSNNLSILIRHHGKVSFAKPVVLEWAPLPVVKSKAENAEQQEELIAAPNKEPTAQYQYLRIPASQDYEVNPLGCQLINLNFGLQFADKEFTQMCKWSVHNWEPLLNEGLVVHYADPIQQNIQLLVQNCGDRKIVIKQGEPLAVIRFHPLPKRITLRYVDNVHQ